MACEESEADQKQKQIRQQNPFMLVMRQQACQPRPLVEAGPQQLLERDDAEADESGGERMTMKNCDAGERGAEQQKIDQHR